MSDLITSRAATTLGELFRNYDGPPFAVRLWNGWTWSSASGDGKPPLCTLVFATPKALGTLLLHPGQVALGEAFLAQEIDVEGDLFSIFEAAEHVLRRPVPLHQRLLSGLGALGHTLTHGPIHSRRRDRASISYHYDQPTEFFRPWLGPTLAYSCAYFQKESDTLDTAQEQKLDLVCRKLRLQPGERLLDIGCGWGSLILHAAGRCGAEADGITLSREQANVTRQRIAGSGLGNCCRVTLRDYRELDPAQRIYDKIASVGMSEHVGLKNLPRYFSLAYRLLQTGGVFLNHAIARSAGYAPRDSDSFIRRYVFPDGELVTLTDTIAAAENAGFEVRDVENLREHYARTLRCWVEGLRRHRAALQERVPEKTYRIWLLYMAGCAAAFRSGDIAIYQVLLSKPDRGQSRLPLTREDWYRSAYRPSAHQDRSPLRPVALADGFADALN
ncbi:MAG TPA: class I SAM-dependent methyltransferase [Acidobacteriaceae bacterium]|nr:class I SAM-dependent methyltransferase [Acidobacteriaceae bacterium]